MPANVPQPARTRQQRVASVELPAGFFGRFWMNLKNSSVLLRVSMCVATALVLWTITRGWEPPFEFYEGQVPQRNILPRVDFQRLDEIETGQKKQEARELAKAVYVVDSEPIENLQAKFESEVNRVLKANNFEELESGLWDSFMPQASASTDDSDAHSMDPMEAFAEFKKELAKEGALNELARDVADALAPLKSHGFLEKLPDEHDANYKLITVRKLGDPPRDQEVAVDTVITENALATFRQRLVGEMDSPRVVAHTFAWFEKFLPNTQKTLTLDADATEKARKAAEDAVGPQYDPFTTEVLDNNVLARRGERLKEEAVALLRLEHSAFLANRTMFDSFKRTFATLGMYVALYTLCGCYIYFRAPHILRDFFSFSILLTLVVVTTALAMLASGTMTNEKWWRAELIPLLLFGMIVAIAYGQELALLLSAAMTLIIAVALGQELTGALVMMASTSGAILVLGRIRNRSKLLTVGFVAAVVAALTTIGVGTLAGEPLAVLALRAAKFALWAIMAGSLMTIILPTIEKIFGVQTDLSLIELGDPAHPLLQELVRRAPGTYNHSINVASLAEAAAEAIGARGLLVRVGAYFHDIGKMLKPGYFIENQSHGDNRHESLVPAMSTLVIIAHVKDGADLARQHKLPHPIIDFIQQHHGTTLVEYFYRRASQQHEADPESGEVDETSFRYPGPKPQTKEAGILMLSDAVESASRVLVEPTPSRIESLVEEITMKRLLDGQFDECGLTLEEVHRVEESLVKSLTAVYHGRVKYPQQESAKAV